MVTHEILGPTILAHLSHITPFLSANQCHDQNLKAHLSVNGQLHSYFDLFFTCEAVLLTTAVQLKDQQHIYILVLQCFLMTTLLMKSGIDLKQITEQKV